MATGMSTSCAKYSTAPAARMATSHTARVSFESVRSVIHRMNVGDSTRAKHGIGAVSALRNRCAKK